MCSWSLIGVIRYPSHSSAACSMDVMQFNLASVAVGFITIIISSAFLLLLGTIRVRCYGGVKAP
jgi:hypothetical protein